MNNRRRDDAEPMSTEQVGVMSFVAGMCFVLIIDIVMRSI